MSTTPLASQLSTSAPSLKQFIRSVALSFAKTYAQPFDNIPVTPLLTGWGALIFTLEGNDDEMVRKILESKVQDLLVESVNPRIVGLPTEEHPSRRRIRYEVVIKEHFPHRQAFELSIASSNGVKNLEVELARPSLLNINIHDTGLRDYYVSYTTTIDGEQRRFSLLSGPLFILERLTEARHRPERRFAIWQQLLLYCLGVNGLPGGRLRRSFNLGDNEEKWLDLVMQNSEGIFSQSSHYLLAVWLNNPLDSQTRMMRQQGTESPRQLFNRIATSLASSTLGKEDVYNKLVELRQNLADELEYICSRMQARVAKRKADQVTRSQTNLAIKSFVPQNRNFIRPPPVRTSTTLAIPTTVSSSSHSAYLR